MKQNLNSRRPAARATRRPKTYREPTEKEITHFAFSIFSQEEPQRALEIWRQAKAQLIADRKHDAGLFQSTDFLPVLAAT